MSRLGKTFIFASCLLMISLFTPLAKAGNLSDCLKQVLETSLALHESHPLAESLAGYNEKVSAPLSSLAHENLSHEFDKALTHLQRMAPSFPKEDFLNWYAEHAFTQEEFLARQSKGAKLGDILHAKVAEFEAEAAQANKVAKAVDEIGTHLRSLQETCGHRTSCYQKDLEAFLPKKTKGLCMMKDPHVITDLTNSFAVYSAGLAITHGRDGAKKFPYELALNNMIWIPILTEQGCLNKERETLKREKLEKEIAGRNLSKEESALLLKRNPWKIAAKNYVFYMKTAWMSEVSYMAMHTGFEKWRGHPVDTNPKHMAAELAAYIGWDVLIAVPRTVILSPAFNGDSAFYGGGFPVLKSALKTSMNPILGTGIGLTADYGLRVGTSAASTWGFGHWEHWTQKIIKEHLFKDEKPDAKK